LSLVLVLYVTGSLEKDPPPAPYLLCLIFRMITSYEEGTMILVLMLSLFLVCPVHYTFIIMAVRWLVVQSPPFRDAHTAAHHRKASIALPRHLGWFIHVLPD